MMKTRVIFKKIIALSLGTAFALPLFACGENGQTGGTPALNVWTATGMEKILRDGDYSARYPQTTLKINAFRNEYESGQIILSPENMDVDAYEVILSDLSLEGDSSVKLSKDCFTLYNQKYVYVDNIGEKLLSASGGYYPDALLPMQTAIAYGENTVEGKNQGVWVTLHTSAEQQAGVYKGNFTLNADGESVNVPVEITLYDHALSNQTHVQSWYGLNWEWVAMAELDVTVEMQERYYDFVLDYRINPGNIPGNFYSQTYPDDFIQTFIARASESAKDERCSFYSLPYSTVNTVADGKTLTVLDLDYHLNLLQEMAKYSVEREVDLFEKAGMYLVFLDEFDAANDSTKTDNASYTLDAFWKFHKSLTEEMVFAKVEGGVDGAFKKQLMQSVLKIAPFIPGDAFELNLEEYPDAKMIPMDRIGQYDAQVVRDAYDEYIKTAYNEEWWYQATSSYPHVSYTTEAPSVNVRFNGWMMYDYGITGDLYWEMAMNHEFSTDYQITYLQNEYDMAMRYPGHNGEGKLLYAGREYGIKGPVGTVRLHAVRDAHEDYDLLYELEELYVTRGVTSEEFNGILQFLVRDMYTGTQIKDHTTAIDSILDSRELLAKLFELYYENGVILHSYEAVKGIATLKLSAPDGTAVTVNGNVLSGMETNGVLSYTYSVAMDKDSNAIDLTAKTGTDENAFSFYLGGKNVVVTATQMQGDFEVKSGAEIAFDGENGCMKATPLQGAEKMSVLLNGGALTVDASSAFVSVRIFVYGNESVELAVKGRCEKETRVRTFGNYTLKAGWNEIKLDVKERLKCDVSGKLSFFQFDVEEGATFGVGDVILEG